MVIFRLELIEGGMMKMEFEKVNLKNYKSISNIGKIPLHNKINIFAGKNNMGKTAFIEGIYKILNGNPVNILEYEKNETNLELEFTVDHEDLPFLYRGVEEKLVISDLSTLKIYYRYNAVREETCLRRIEIFHQGLYKPIYINESKMSSKREQIEYTRLDINGRGDNLVGIKPQFINNLNIYLQEKVVFISGSRYVPEKDNTDLAHSLSIDGTNLHTFLYTLHNNNENDFDKIKKTFIDIFNEVSSISTPISSGNKTNISIYFKGEETPIPLSNCGSGFTHVLLLLCVLFTKRKSVVLFDEPHVFLHPSAEKAIYDLINETDEHQYLLTTHSPILINYPFDKDIFLVEKEGGSSVFSQLKSMQEILTDIGVNNSDFALSDKVLFVEGETEEKVFPLILSHFGMKQLGYNYRILRMNGTGNEFSKKSAMTRHKEKLDLILKGVSESPIPYKIVIDRDEKNEDKLREIKEKYGENVMILERREIENYFLESYTDISILINSESKEEVIGPDDVREKICDILAEVDDKKLYPRSSETPINDVVGSEVLERLFKEFSLTYNKVEHGRYLTDSVLKNNPVLLEFFKNELKEFMLLN